MKSDQQLQIDSFLRNLARSSTSLLMLDYDGTLAPFRRKRDLAFPYPGVARLLQGIMCAGRTRVVIVSGRDASETIPLLGVEPRPEVWGLHGLQRVRPDGVTKMSGLDRRTLDALLDARRWLAYQQLRHVAEFKTGSLAVHWRGLSEPEAEELRSRVLLGWRPIAERDGLDLLEFDGGVEIRSHVADKGDVVRILLGEIPPDTPAAYLGDDNTDEPAFRAIRDRGLSILVRPQFRQTAAQIWLKPPEELLAFLTRWHEACQRRAAFGNETAATANG